MNTPWFKFYHEVRNDAKLRLLNDKQHRIWLHMLIYASEQYENRGTVPTKDLEYLSIEVSNGDIEALDSTIKMLIRLRILQELDDGYLFINFANRQCYDLSDNPDAVRKRRQRLRQKEEREQSVMRPGHVPDASRNVRDNFTEKRREEEDTEPEEEEDPNEHLCGASCCIDDLVKWTGATTETQRQFIENALACGFDIEALRYATSEMVMMEPEGDFNYFTAIVSRRFAKGILTLQQAFDDKEARGISIRDPDILD